MTGSTCIRHLQRLCGRGSDELKSMGADIDVGDRLLYFRHVAAYAFVARAACLMVRVRLNSGCVRTVGGVRPMALKAQHVCWLQEIGVVVRAVHVMAAKTAHAVGVHLARNEIVALHPVLVRRAIGEMCKRLFPKLVLFQLPEVLKTFPYLKPNRPIVVLAFDGVLQGLALRVALDADVIRLYKIEPSPGSRCSLATASRRGPLRGRGTFRSLRSIR